jgi:hypothetical protein
MKNTNVSPYEVLYHHSCDTNSPYPKLHRARILSLSRYIYQVIPEKALDTIQRALENHDDIRLTTSQLARIFELLPEEKPLLFTEDWEKIVDTGLEVVSQYFLGCRWPEPEAGPKVMQDFVNLLKREMRHHIHHDLDKPHSYK